MSTVRQLFAAAGLAAQGCVRWGTKPTLDAPGVYVVSMSSSVDDPCSPVAFCANREALQTLLLVRPEIAVDGIPATEESLRARLGQMWLSSEPVLYIGLAGTSVKTRVNQYYRTPLGARSPHAGGWPIKLLSSLSELWVHYAATNDPGAAEIAMIAAFQKGVPRAVAAVTCDPGHPLPYANLTFPGGRRKAHGISGAKESRHSLGSPLRRASTFADRSIAG